MGRLARSHPAYRSTGVASGPYSATQPDAKDKVVDLTALGPSSYVLKELDMASEKLVLWQGDRLFSVDFNGKLTYEFGRPAEARPQYTTYQEMGRFWLAWDAYREDGSYR